jgi:hypothetical protein
VFIERIDLTSSQSGATVDCGPTRHAIAGGGYTSGNAFYRSYPSDATGTAFADNTTNPRYWTTTFASTGTGQLVYAICVNN